MFYIKPGKQYFYWMRLIFTPKLLIIAGTILFGIIANSFCQESNGINIGGLKTDIGSGILLDSDGNILIAGTTRSYGNGGDDIILVKMDSYGNIIFQKTYQKEHHEKAYGIEECPDGNYMIVGEAWDGGFGREDLYLLKVSKQGEKIWEKYYGGYHTDQGFSVKSIKDGYIALGYTSSQPETTMGNFYLVRTDLDGNMLWENNYGTEYLDFGFEILPLESGDFWLLGTAGGFFNMARADYTNPEADLLLIKVDKHGEEITRNYFGGFLHDWGKDLVETEDGTMYLLGSTQSEGAGSFDMYLVKVDPEGNQIWDETYGESDFEYGNAMGIDQEGNLFLLGTKQHPQSALGPDIYIIKADSDGQVIWEQSLGGLGSDYGYDLIVMPDSGCAIVGEIQNTESKYSDIYYVRLDKNGEIMGIDIPGDTIQQETVKFFPNPVFDKASIEWEGPPPPGGFRLLIFSLTGQVVYSQVFESRKKIDLELGSLPQGTYLYQVVYGKKKLKGKFTTR